MYVRPVLYDQPIIIHKIFLARHIIMVDIGANICTQYKAVIFGIYLQEFISARLLFIIHNTVNIIIPSELIQYLTGYSFYPAILEIGNRHTSKTNCNVKWVKIEIYGNGNGSTVEVFACPCDNIYRIDLKGFFTYDLTYEETVKLLLLTREGAWIQDSDDNNDRELF